ncbi:hypothetical protein C2S52_011624 [Perilla frutescens var. hirtella]|nr:hypothetical protein C2S52_011624 [Perilla frutescens var. hirtella]
MQTPPPGPPSPMSSSSSAAGAVAAEVDASIWRAVAGASVRIPAVNSYVYYFPQGHLEQCSGSAVVNNYNFTQMRPWILCQVISVRFLSDRASDQAFARILLQPIQPHGARPRSNEIIGDDADDDDIVSFAKILTRSDANNGGGFSVPRFCADMILPQLNFAADPPVQNLVMRDTQNNAWEFRHIYRGTPRRHLLTTGWSKYVNAKRLVAGDSVVFMRKKSTNELFVGVRRAERFGGDADVDGAEALSAIENAVRGMPFEVVYYPKVGFPDFVVMAEKVKESLRMLWGAGMRVRMAVETDDSSRMTWIQGVVTTATTPATGLWCGSPWRMLQVTWDDHESSENVNKVSPWQVEYIPLSPLIDPDFPPSKRFKLLQDSGMLPSDPEKMSYTFPPTEFSHSIAVAGHLLNYSHPLIPAGMQGARRDHLLTVTTGLSITTNKELPRNEIINDPVSTVLSIGSSYSDIVSPVSQSSVHSGQAPSSSFLLFGKTIQMSSELGEGGNRSCTCGGEGCDAHI